jgi:N-acetylglucosaminyldiphosphoundecaprenol N-acetyl-beta-D-mannosaminyltransferase
MGLDFDALTEDQTVGTILAALAQGRGGWVLTPNLEHLRAYQMTDEIQREFDCADLVVPDGMPLLWASRLKNEALPGRVAGSDLIWSVSRAAAQSGASGGRPAATGESRPPRARRTLPAARLRAQPTASGRDRA